MTFSLLSPACVDSSRVPFNITVESSLRFSYFTGKLSENITLHHFSHGSLLFKWFPLLPFQISFLFSVRFPGERCLKCINTSFEHFVFLLQSSGKNLLGKTVSSTNDTLRPFSTLGAPMAQKTELYVFVDKHIVKVSQYALLCQ